MGPSTSDHHPNGESQLFGHRKVPDRNNQTMHINCARELPIASSPLPAPEAEKMLAELRKEFHLLSIKHSEETYWLRLELGTARREKEAAEDRMAELYRDLHEIEDLQPTKSATKVHTLDTQFVLNLQNQIQKYERIVRVNKNQISILRSSSENVVDSLREEIVDLMDEKCKMEIELMNKLADLEREKRELQQSISGNNTNKTNNGAETKDNEWTIGEVPDVGKAKTTNGILEKEVERLHEDLIEERRRTEEMKAHWQSEKLELSEQVEKLHGEMNVLRSTAEAVQSIDMVKRDREETLTALDRVALLWDRADKSIQGLEGVMTEIKPREDQVQDDRERFLSTLESASLVHGQVKVSLMLTELKLRNNLAYLHGEHGEGVDSLLDQRIKQIESEALTSIRQVSESVEGQMEQLEYKSNKETLAIQERMETKLSEMQRLEERQKSLEKELGHLRKEEAMQSTQQCNICGGGDSASNLNVILRAENRSDNESTNTSTANFNDLFVSRKVLGQLQSEVLQVVERVREKDEIIGRLEASLEELKVRERSITKDPKGESPYS